MICQDWCPVSFPVYLGIMNYPSLKLLCVLLFMGFLTGCQTGRKMQQASNPLPGLLASYPQYFDSILKNRPSSRVQIIYTQINRERNGKPVLTDHYYPVDKNEYFYPASTIKLPVALLALQRLNELKIPGCDRNTTMITETGFEGETAVYNDPSTPDGRPTIAHYIKKILLVSDNDASNRLYEFLGQEYINSSLHKMGYDSVQILHRLNIFLTEEQNRRTNPVNFYDTGSRIIFSKPSLRSELVYADRNTRMGTGFMRNGQLVNEPFDFSRRNRLPLSDLHSILKSVIFPKAVPRKQRFNIRAEDRSFVLKSMSMLPRESQFPFYDSSVHDNNAKFLFYGAERRTAVPALRIFNKIGGG